MVDHFKKLLIRQGTVHLNSIPQLLIHVIAGGNFGVAFAQFNSQFRVALYIELVAKAYTGEQK